MLEIRFVKKISAWALSNSGLVVFMIVVFYFHFYHDRIFAFYSPTDIKFFLGAILSHFMLFYYIWSFVSFLHKKNFLTLRVGQSSVFTKSGEKISFDRIIVKRRRMDENLADIIFVNQHKTLFKVDVCYVGETGLEKVIADLNSLGCSIEVQKNML